MTDAVSRRAVPTPYQNAPVDHLQWVKEVVPMLETTTCPECGLVSEVRERCVLESTDGPVEHARIRCVGRHHFLLPLYSLELQRASAPIVRPAPVTLG